MPAPHRPRHWAAGYQLLTRSRCALVTDNIVIQFVPSEKRDGLTIERRSGNTKPDVPPRHILNGEWGPLMHAQSFAAREERNLLIDFGYTPEVLNNNMAILGIEPSCFDAIVLSHGHYHVFGGVARLFESVLGACSRKDAVVCWW